jgi:hypothetical protein
VVTTHRTGKRGRPRKIIDPSYLQEALAPDRNISRTGLSRVLKIHRHTVRRAINDAGISQSYMDLSDNDLDDLLKAFKLQKPESGFRYALGFLRNHGIRIQQRRVLQSLRRVDPIGRILRERRTTRRREYHVARPNSLWHCDGHHKLIAWGIVIHGIIDGFCRTVTIFFLVLEPN